MSSSRRALRDLNRNKNDNKTNPRNHSNSVRSNHSNGSIDDNDALLDQQPPPKKSRFHRGTSSRSRGSSPIPNSGAPPHNGVPHQAMESTHSRKHSRKFGGRYSSNYPPSTYSPTSSFPTTYSPGGRMKSRYYGPDCEAPAPPPTGRVPNGFPRPNGYPYVHGTHGGNHHSNHYYMSQVLYVPYNMVYQDTPGHPNSSSSPNEEESAYDCFMAKSNDKHADKH